MSLAQTIVATVAVAVFLGLVGLVERCDEPMPRCESISCPPPE